MAEQDRATTDAEAENESKSFRQMTWLGGVIGAVMFAGLSYMLPGGLSGFYASTIGQVFRHEAIIFANIDQCEKSGEISPSQCKADLTRALEAHRALRPRYMSLQACADVHRNSCMPMPAKAGGITFTFATFGPTSVGWMTPSPGESEFHPQVVYKHKEPGTFITAAGKVIDGDYGRHTLRRTVTKLPDATSIRSGGGSVVIRVQ